jgi:hypothetical protein
MRTILFALNIMLFANACGNSGQPALSSGGSSQSEPAAVANSEQQGNSFSISTEAFYQATIQSPNSQGKIISLSLTPKHRAEMITNHVDNTQGMIDTGEWKTLQNGNLHLKLRRIGSKDSTQLEFTPDGEKLVYVGKEYGPAGLVLWVKPVPSKK